MSTPKKRKHKGGRRPLKEGEVANVVAFKLTSDDAASLKALAAKRGVSKSDVIRQALAREFEAAS